MDFLSHICSPGSVPCWLLWEVGTGFSTSLKGSWYLDSGSMKYKPATLKQWREIGYQHMAKDESPWGGSNQLDGLVPRGQRAAQMRGWQPVSEAVREDLYPDSATSGWDGLALLSSECILFILAIAASLRGKRFQTPLLDLALRILLDSLRGW